MISKISKILEKKDLSKFQMILALNFTSFFLEFVSLALIPLFVSFILEVETVLNKLESYGFFYFSGLNNEELIKYLGLLIIFVFIIKNVFYYFLIHVQGQFEKNVKIKLSKKLLNFYVTRPFSYHLENNPAKLYNNKIAYQWANERLEKRYQNILMSTKKNIPNDHAILCIDGTGTHIERQVRRMTQAKDAGFGLYNYMCKSLLKLLFYAMKKESVVCQLMY